MNDLPKWVAGLEAEELNFVKNFVLASGSLKEMAQIYGVTYPTVRARLNRVIEQIKLAEEQQEDSYVTLIKKMAIEEKIDFDAATVLIREYRKEKEEL